MTADRPEDMIEVLRVALEDIRVAPWYEAASVAAQALRETGLSHVDEDQEGAER